MLLQITLFEIKYRLRRPATYIYFLILFAMCFLIMTLPDASVSEAGEQLHKNAPYIIYQLVSSFMLFSSIIIAGIMGVPVFRDYEYKINEIVFSLPVRKWEYLGGKFLGSYIITVFVHIGLVLGLWAGTLMPWVEKTDLSPFVLEAYINPIFILVLPNIFILGLIFFMVGTIFRSQLAIYSQGLIFVVLYFLLSRLMNDIDTNPVSSIFEPFGTVAASFETKYWTTFEKNTLLLPLSGYIIWNRLFWLGLSMLIMIVFYFTYNLSSKPLLRKRKQEVADPEIINQPKQKIEFSTSTVSFTTKAKFYQWWYFSRFHFIKILKAIPFWIMLACGIGLLLIARMGTSMIGTPQLPVTYELLSFLKGSFIIFAVIIIAIYVGELIWKDIDVKIAPVVDSTPMPDWLITFSKFTAIVMVEIFIIFFIMLTGISIQISEGFYHFQLLVYLKVLMLTVLPYLVILTFLIFLIHTLINNKYVGHTIIVIFFLLNLFAAQIGLEHVLIRYGSTIEKGYSDMNGYHHFVFPALIVDAYWFTLGAIFLVLSILFIKRGNKRGFTEQVQNFKLNFKQSKAAWIIPSLLIVFILTGAFIYYNTNILNTFRNRKANREHMALYERTYSKYKDYPQPRIISIKVNADIYPDDIRFEMKGHYSLVNKNKQTIDTIHLRTSPWIKINKLDFSIPVETIDSSKKYGYYIYKCLNPFKPGDTISLDFDFTYAEKGFHFWGHSTDLVYNGTFVHQEFLPSFGYNDDGELHDKKDRKKAGLPKKEFESYNITDTARYANMYINKNADRISYEAIVSTVPDQTAITCGTLVDEWTENNRRYFHYKMNEPIWNFMPFMSAKYSIYEEDYKGLKIAIYYHKSHDYNIHRMVDAVKKTVDYCNTNFYPYQHKNIRIVEFPNYMSYAQSFAGTIPFSEAIGFILKVDKKNDIDVPFFVSSHEVAHQWWGHMVCGADVKGKTLMVESLAQYTSLMVMLQEFGNDKTSKFLKYELDRYMLLRAAEKKKEPPLYLVDNQNYLSYEKGCLAFYNLQDFIGEDTLNKALSEFIAKYYYHDAPYPTSLDLLSYVDARVPDSLKYLINDWFKTITLYENKTDSATYSKTKEGKFLVSFHTTSKKYVSDSLGKQEPLPLHDWLEIGIFTKNANKKDSLIYLKKVLIAEQENSFSILVDKEPSQVGIDPLNKQIDRNLFDNKKTAKKL